jgi:beta-lactamase class A
LLGRGSINRSVEALGLWDTVLPAPGTRTGIFDVDGVEVAVTSPRDELCLLTLMAKGQLLGPGVSAEMRQLLLRQRINDRLPALLPPDARVAHKTGELPGVRNDVGIVYARPGTYVVVVLARGVEEGYATAAIARLSRRLYDHFMGVG